MTTTAYLDSNATSRPAPEVVEAMLVMLRDEWANPSSVHRFGQQARQRVELAREQVCRLINCRPRELVFTSGATESNNLAIRGMLAARPNRRTVITTRLEHSAVRQPCARLAEIDGYNVIYLPVDIDGLVDLNALDEHLRSNANDVALVAIHWINNETGTIQPIERIGELCAQHGVPFFSDATQAIGKVPCDLAKLPFAAMSFAGHKFHGPKGSGGLFIRRGTGLVPQTLGGPHERERRGGTENTPGIVGLGVACELAQQFLASDGPVVGKARRDRLERAILDEVPGSVLNSAGAPRLWNTTNIGFPPLESEAILVLLSERGICAAAGAACSSGSLEPSPVLLAQGIEEAVAHGSIRLSLSRYTTDEEIDYAIATVPRAIERLRASMPADKGKVRA
ncbi:MAG: aminotransferase class V-fold PLP-dependent enzyme [Planctomycetes bacterium]|nr:aminotransferase class V-fold PLP-dependent enzyme [Planctomycetota bacterium]